MRVFTTLFRPLIWLFNDGANRLVRLVGSSQSTSCVPHTPSDELGAMLEEARSAGSVERESGEIVARTLEFPHKVVREVMVRRSDVHAIAAGE